MTYRIMRDWPRWKVWTWVALWPVALYVLGRGIRSLWTGFC